MDLKKLSDSATQGRWSVTGSSGDEVIIETDAPTVHPIFGKDARVVSSSEWTHMSDEDAEFVCAIVNAFRSGKLVEI